MHSASASLPVILNLLGLWLFLFFAIMYTEVFDLAKWCCRGQLSQLPNYGNGLSHAGVLEHRVSGLPLMIDRLPSSSTAGRDGTSSCMTSKVSVWASSQRCSHFSTVPRHTPDARMSLKVSFLRIAAALPGHSRCSSHGACSVW